MPKHGSHPLPRPPSAGVARELLLKVRELGGDAVATAHRAGIGAAADEMLKPAWNGTVSPAQFTQLYRECVAMFEAHDSRRQGWPPMTKREVDMLCYCIITCATLDEAIARATDFCTMLGARAAELSVQINGEQAVFRMRTFRRKRDAAAFLSDLTGLSSYHRLFSWLIGENIELLSVEVSYPELIEEEVTGLLMPHPISYDRADNLLLFPAHYLHRPVVRSYGELIDFLKDFPFDLETTHSKQMPLSEKVRIAIGGALARRAPLPTLETLARQFGISGATLKRRLAQEGASMQLLKERCRHDLARKLLADPALAFGEIAHRLSFSDATTFSRAFKGWSGQSPSAYRDAMAPAEAA